MSVFNIPTQLEEMSLQEHNVITYIGGYIVKKFKNKSVICENFLSKICADSDDLGNSKYEFVSAKNYSEAMVGLHMPSTLLTQALDQCELEYSKIIDTCIYLEDVKSTLVALLIKEV